MTVVGVVSDVKHNGLAEAAPPEIYLPMAQLSDSLIESFGRSLSFVVQSDGDPARLAPAIREHAAALDNGQPLYDFQTLDRIVSLSVAGPRLRGVLFGAFAGLALVLAITGVYGVMAYAVARRVRETAIRLALGAQRADILRLLIGRGMAQVAAGILVGLGAALAVSRYVASLVFRAPQTDPIIYVFVAVLVAGAGLAACWVPARRATRTDPLAVLRAE